MTEPTTLLGYDSVNAESIPADTTFMMGYCDGIYSSYYDMKARFPDAIVISITVEGTPGARIADCEGGCMGIGQTAKWCLAEIAQGRRPTVYSTADFDIVIKQTLGAENISKVDWFLAGWDNRPSIPTGYVGHQYWGGVGEPYDKDIVLASWATGKDAVPTTRPPNPQPVDVIRPVTGKYGVLNKPAVAVLKTSTGEGYTIVAADGGTFNYGDAQFIGSLAGRSLAKPIVDAAMTNDNKGLIMVGTDGGVFNFGTSKFYGSIPSLGVKLAAPIVGVNLTPTDAGYWLVGADGGIFAFGDAKEFGTPA